MYLRRMRMHVNYVNVFVDAQNAKPETVTKKRVNRAVEQHFLNDIAAGALVPRMKLLAQIVAHSVRRIFRDLFDVYAFADLLRRADQHAVNHSDFSATIRY